ncbi:hypothetical protein E2320_004569 [Naja naja]|nr:hypothetical protein E2320_004569 [Naja naja]
MRLAEEAALLVLQMVVLPELVLAQERLVALQPPGLEPGGRYLYHFTPEKGSKTGKPAQVIADNLVYFMKKKTGIDKSLKAIGGDSTKVNTGCEDGAMHWIEVKPDHPLYWS